ncbi:MAG: maleylacetoacetate isomerase [Gammaproteobacteria bacterium]|nr:maleylacetoacetate isomerase [Gammaproteobacteria bacterium]
MRLYSYWRSSAAHRVRIALNLKGLDYEIVPVHLLEQGGRQHLPDYVRLNPQHLVPTLVHDDFTLGQSLAILQYLEAIAPEPPLVPREPRAAARMWQICHLIACDIHPLNNLRVLQYLEREFAVDPRARWYAHWIALGFEALEALLAQEAQGEFCCGDAPTLADVCLVPQVASAQRVALDLTPYPRIAAVDARCGRLETFRRAAPAAQPDAQP